MGPSAGPCPPLLGPRAKALVPVRCSSVSSLVRVAGLDRHRGDVLLGVRRRAKSPAPTGSGNEVAVSARTVDSAVHTPTVMDRLWAEDAGHCAAGSSPLEPRRPRILGDHQALAGVGVDGRDLKSGRGQPRAAIANPRAASHLRCSGCVSRQRPRGQSPGSFPGGCCLPTGTSRSRGSGWGRSSTLVRASQQVPEPSQSSVDLFGEAGSLPHSTGSKRRRPLMFRR